MAPVKHLDVDESFPVFTLQDNRGWDDAAYPPQEFTEEELADYQRVNKEFADWQRRLSERFGIGDRFER